MTNKHVVERRSIIDIEYIDFPKIAFVRKNQEEITKSYLSSRQLRGNTAVKEGLANLEKELRI